jgi:hypothetical protein
MYTNLIKKVPLSALIALLLLSLLFSLGIAAPEAAVKHWKVKGTIQALETFEVNLVTMTMDVDGYGSGRASKLGRFTYEYHAVVNLLNGQGSGSAELVAANGDRLFANLNGQGTPIDPPDVHRVVDVFTITGGTGRFANASGSLTLDRIINTATGVTSGKIAGTIIIPK